jgi:hypothetical protein
MSVTRPHRNTTIMVELKMENQWIWCPKKLWRGTERRARKMREKHGMSGGGADGSIDRIC